MQVKEILVDVEPAKANFLAQEIERLLDGSFFNHYGREPYVTVSVRFEVVTPVAKTVVPVKPVLPTPKPKPEPKDVPDVP